MLHRQAGVEALLLGSFQFGRSRAALLAFGNEGGQFGHGFRHLLRHRMVGGDGDEAGAEHSVGPGREHFDAVGTVNEAEQRAQALALADPVFLHQPDLLRPAIEGRQTFEEFFGEVGDL